MTKKEAIKLLIPLRNSMVDQYGCPISDVVFALDVAIEALEKGSVCGDAISREYMLNIIGTYFSNRGDFGSTECFWVLEAIRNAPSLESEPKQGKWLVDRYCSECEWDKKDVDFTSGWRENYCPNCGAKMEGDTE